MVSYIWKVIYIYISFYSCSRPIHASVVDLELVGVNVWRYKLSKVFAFIFHSLVCKKSKLKLMTDSSRDCFLIRKDLKCTVWSIITWECFYKSLYHLATLSLMCLFLLDLKKWKIIRKIFIVFYKFFSLHTRNSNKKLKF